MEHINFRQFLEISGTGSYSDLVPRWRGSKKGPFDDPKRMSNDPKFWRDQDYKRQIAALQYDKTRQAHQADPKDPKAREDYIKSAAERLLATGDTVPESKPRGEYQGWANWDTWAVALWAGNESKRYNALRMQPLEKIKKYCTDRIKSIQRFFKDGDDGHDVDLDMVNWEEIYRQYNTE